MTNGNRATPGEPPLELMGCGVGILVVVLILFVKGLWIAATTLLSAIFQALAGVAIGLFSFLPFFILALALILLPIQLRNYLEDAENRRWRELGPIRNEIEETRSLLLKKGLMSADIN